MQANNGGGDDYNEIEGLIETAEENGDVDKLLSILDTCCSKHIRDRNNTKNDRSSNNNNNNNKTGEHEWSTDDNDNDDDHDAIIEATLDAYYRLTKALSSTGRGILIDDSNTNAIQMLVRCLRGFKKHEAIVEVGLGCIINTCYLSPISKDDIDLSREAAIFLVDIMKLYPLLNEICIQKQLCLAIVALSTADKVFQESFIREGGKKELIKQFHHQNDNERNKSHIIQAAEALGIRL